LSLRRAKVRTKKQELKPLEDFGTPRYASQPPEHPDYVAHIPGMIIIKNIFYSLEISTNIYDN